MSSLHHPLSPPQTFNGFSSLGIKPKLLTCSRKYCVPGHSWPLQPHLLPHLSSFSPPQKHCLSCVLCFLLLGATSLDLGYSPDSLPPFPQPLRSEWRHPFLRGASLASMRINSQEGTPQGSSHPSSQLQSYTYLVNVCSHT